jgi:hypothetical protein
VDEKFLTVQYEMNTIQGISPEILRAVQSLALELSENIDQSQLKTLHHINDAEDEILRSLQRLGRSNEVRHGQLVRAGSKVSRVYSSLAER